MNITNNEAVIVEQHTEDFNEELYVDFLEIVGKRKEIGDKLKKELETEFPSDILETFIKRYNHNNLKSNKTKGKVVDSCVIQNLKYPNIIRFDLYKSETTSQLLGYTKKESMCLILNSTIIKNTFFDKFISKYLSDVKNENTADNIFSKIQKEYAGV